jgi:hypothetical protein
MEKRVAPLVIFLIYSGVMFGAGYLYRQHSVEAPTHDSQAARLSMLAKL